MSTSFITFFAALVFALVADALAFRCVLRRWPERLAIARLPLGSLYILLRGKR